MHSFSNKKDGLLNHHTKLELSPILLLSVTVAKSHWVRITPLLQDRESTAPQSQINLPEMAQSARAKATLAKAHQTPGPKCITILLPPGVFYFGGCGV